MDLPLTDYHLLKDNPVEKLFWGRLYLEKASSYFDYKSAGNVSKIMYRFKYRGDRELALAMGRYMAQALYTDGFFEGIDLIIPVPLHKRKKRKRGYNQSELIVKGISETTGIPFNTVHAIRHIYTQSQTRYTSFQRMENVKGVFKINNPELLSGKHILIVDDVLTTGATLTSLGEELLKVDNVKLSVLTLAVAQQ